MTILSAIAVYLIIWWLVLFCVLPWGVRDQWEDTSQKPVPGSAQGAPANPHLFAKCIITTAISAVILSLLYFVISENLISLDDIPFLPDFRDTTFWRLRQ